MKVLIFQGQRAKKNEIQISDNFDYKKSLFWGQTILKWITKFDAKFLTLSAK